MAGLQRSEISFRRQGSSGLVWDDKLISEELNSEKPSSDQKPELRRSRSDGGGRRHTVKVEQAEDPPSPRMSTCGFCSYFGRPAAAAVKTNKRKSGKARHR
ncbi:MAPK kinase substrate protein At1g80180 [Silene latifolia]|uniref:MAPK kinase substrate protein At1g80180 n=1 Tax=Silene latifolia TaxID=37657 RepID=UPI003D76E669